jgi:hypothetical protein
MQVALGLVVAYQGETNAQKTEGWLVVGVFLGLIVLAVVVGIVKGIRLTKGQAVVAPQLPELVAGQIGRGETVRSARFMRVPTTRRRRRRSRTVNVPVVGAVTDKNLWSLPYTVPLSGPLSLKWTGASSSFDLEKIGSVEATGMGLEFEVDGIRHAWLFSPGAQPGGEDLVHALRAGVSRPQQVTSVSVTEELTGLARLHHDGVLSDQEWERAKEMFIGAQKSEQDDAVRLLGDLNSLYRGGALSEGEFNMKKWDILSKVKPDA